MPQYTWLGHVDAVSGSEEDMIDNERIAGTQSEIERTRVLKFTCRESCPRPGPDCGMAQARSEPRFKLEAPFGPEALPDLVLLSGWQISGPTAFAEGRAGH